MIPYITLAAAPVMTVALTLGAAGLWFGGATLSTGIGVTSLLIGVATMLPILN